MPSLTDDGRTVTLDLHGATVDEAVALAQAVTDEATRRGRTRITFIHGTSTSSTRYRNRTIKHALYDLVDDGHLSGVTGAWRHEARLTCSLGVTTAPQDPTPIQLWEL